MAPRNVEETEIGLSLDTGVHLPIHPRDHRLDVFGEECGRYHGASVQACKVPGKWREMESQCSTHKPHGSTLLLRLCKFPSILSSLAYAVDPDTNGIVANIHPSSSRVLAPY
jgi:hypothetical protein